MGCGLDMPLLRSSRVLPLGAALLNNFFDTAHKLLPKDSLPSPLISLSHIQKAQSSPITKYRRKATQYQIL